MVWFLQSDRHSGAGQAKMGANCGGNVAAIRSFQGHFVAVLG